MPCNECPKKTKKICKKSSSSSTTEDKCYAQESVVECCSAAYQRQDKLRNAWSLIGGFGPVFLSSVFNSVNRNGVAIASPDATLFGVNGVALTTDAQSNAFYAYYFVNSHRYLQYEECAKSDQVDGWYIDTNTGQLEIFQDLPQLHINSNESRLDYANIVTPTTLQKSKLHSFNTLYKLSEKTIKHVHANPKEEGSTVEIVDKYNTKWLITINRANSTGSALSNNTAFVLVVTKM